MRYLIFFLLFSGCNSQLIELASEYQTNVVYLDALQKQLRLIHSDCDFESDCFKDRAKPWLEDQICTEDQFQNYGFVSQKECERAGFELMDLISGVQRSQRETALLHIGVKKKQFSCLNCLLQDLWYSHHIQ